MISVCRPPARGDATGWFTAQQHSAVLISVTPHQPVLHMSPIYAARSSGPGLLVTINMRQEPKAAYGILSRRAGRCWSAHSRLRTWCIHPGCLPTGPRHMYPLHRKRHVFISSVNSLLPSMLCPAGSACLAVLPFPPHLVLAALANDTPEWSLNWRLHLYGMICEATKNVLPALLRD